MKSVRMVVGRTFRFALGAVVFSGCLATQQASAQAPYLLPYTIQNLGSGTAPTVGATCVGTNGVVGTAYDAFGDGCPISSGSVVIGSNADLHDVGVDAQGNIYFLDNSSTNGFVRRIDARSGIVTAYAGTASATQPTVNCGLPTPTQDKFGDGCPANDGKANATPATGTYGYTANLAKARGISVSRNGDVYIADYNSYTVQKISLATGTMNLVAGLLAGGTVAAPKGYTGQTGYSGDGGIAAGISGAKINAPRGVAADAADNVYIADSGNNVIRKVTFATGIISTYVGVYPGSSTAATSGFSGDGGPATAAQLATPEDVEVDSFGNVYIGDFGNNRIRIVYAGGAVAAKLIALTNAGAVAAVGNIYTIIGGGAGTYVSGTIVPSTSTTIGNPRKIALDARGNVYVADNTNNVIWFLDASTGFMRVIAGEYGKTSATGTSCNSAPFGDGCPATQASFLPTGTNGASLGVAVDLLGNILVSDSGDKELRRVNTNQSFAATVNTATLSQILVVHFAAADAPAAVTPFAINGSTDFTITNTACTINADTTQDCQVTVAFSPTRPGAQAASLIVKSSLNGTGNFGLSGTGSAAAVALDPGTTSSFAAALNNPQGVAQDAAGNTYIADTANNRVLRFTGPGAFTVFAGTGVAGSTGDNGQAIAATLNAPQGVAIARNGSVLISDTGNNTIRSVSPASGVITTYAGGATAVCALAVDTFGDGCPLAQTTFSKPTGLAADLDGNVYVSDTGNNVVRELTVGGYSAYVAGGATTVCGSDPYGNGCAPSASIFNGPTGLAVDANRNLYVADTGNNEVRKIGANQLVSLVAGTGANGASGNGGPATGAQLNSPTGVAVDAGSNIYIADTGNSVVRLVNSLGTINTTIGTLSASGTGTLPGSAFAVQLASPSAVVSNGAGRLIVLDAGNNRAILVDRGSVNFTFNRTVPGTTSAALQIQETVTGSTAAVLGGTLFTTTGTPAAFGLSGTTSNGCSASATQQLAPGTSCLLSATFTPPALGNYTATFTESATNTINSPAPFITLSGTGALLTKTTSVSTLTGTATYAVPFTVTTTVTPASCNTAAPSCSPTGTVTYFVDGTQVGVPQNLPATGITSISISGLSVGVHNVVAIYSGDGYYAGSTAATLPVTIATGITKTVVTPSPVTSPQFSNLVLTATVSGPIATSFPTGSISFYAGTTLVGTSVLPGNSGTVTLKDVDIPATKSSPEITPKSFNLPAGTYNLTAVYSGDANYAPSTSAGTPLIIAPDPASYVLALAPAATGTAQGSTGQTTLFLTPSNTLSGTLTFSCSGMPANADCTFSPSTLVFTPVAGPATAQSTQVTLFTDVPAGVLSKNVSPDLFGRNGGTSSLASMLGWPVLLLSMVGMLGFRKQLRKTRLLAALALFGLLAGGSVVLTGCDNVNHSTSLTPIGVYNVTITVKGGNGGTQTVPLTFTVTTGVAGQL